MINRHLLALVVGALLACHAPASQAQARLSTDFLAAIGTGAGNAVPNEPTFLSLGATLVAGVVQRGPAKLMAGVSISRQFDGDHGDVGYPQPGGTSIGGPWPFFRSLSALAALDVTGPIAARVTAGAGVFRDHFAYTTGGLSGSVDLTFPGRTRVGLLLSRSGTVLPAYRGSSYRTRSFGIGVRFSSR